MDGWMRISPFQNKIRLAEAAAGKGPRLSLPAMLHI